MENDDPIKRDIQKRNESGLIPLVEDVADWLARYLHQPIKASNFLDCIENGVILCQLAGKMEKDSYDYVNETDKIKVLKCLPEFQYKCHTNAIRGTFFARENADGFIAWCRELGFRDTTLFESEDLISKKK